MLLVSQTQQPFTGIASYDTKEKANLVKLQIIGTSRDDSEPYTCSQQRSDRFAYTEGAHIAYISIARISII